MKQKTRILIYVLIAIAVVIMGSIAILSSQKTEKPAAAQEHLDLGRIYLTDLSYDKAVIEFTEAIEIEPSNPDAYLGLADAYVGTGDEGKAAEILEEGYEKTKDERLKEKLDEIKPPAETTAVTTVTAEETTMTVSTAALAVVPNLSGLTEEEAIAACENADLDYVISYDYSDNVREGYVIEQVIPEDSAAAKGMKMPFTVSKGSKIAVVTAPPSNELTTIQTTVPEFSHTSVVSETTTVPSAVQTSPPVSPEITATSSVHTTAPVSDKKSDSKSDTKPGTTAKTTVFDSDKTSSPKSDKKSETSVKTEESGEYITIKGNKYPVSLTELDLSEMNLTDEDIKELGKMVNLTYLNLNGNKISDISFLKNLKNLTELYMVGNNISDISVLRELTNLTIINLNGNQIKAVTALAGLTNLEVLNLGYNQISDISALSGLKKLSILILNDNQITYIGALSGLTELGFLNLSGNKISDISPIKDMKNLYELYIDKNDVKKDDVNKIKESCPGCYIDIPTEDYITIKGEKYSTSLTSLDLEGKGLTDEDIQPLSHMVNLTRLNLGSNRIRDISVLSNLKKLNTLYLDNNYIYDIYPLAGLRNLVILHLEWNYISDITALKYNYNLYSLFLAGNRISDITPLSELSYISILYLNKNQIEDISALENLSTLTKLYLNYNQIDDISALKKLTNLTDLDISSNKLKVKDVNGLKDVLKKCKIKS